MCACMHVCVCVCVQIISAGSGGVLRHWSINGEALASVPSEHVRHIFSCNYNTSSNRNQASQDFAEGVGLSGLVSW